jgi:hypothetical protein
MLRFVAISSRVEPTIGARIVASAERFKRTVRAIHGRAYAASCVAPAAARPCVYSIEEVIHSITFLSLAAVLVRIPK